MMYHLQVDGKVIKANLTRRKVYEYFDLLAINFPNFEVSVLATPGVYCVDQEVKK